MKGLAGLIMLLLMWLQALVEGETWAIVVAVILGGVVVAFIAVTDEVRALFGAATKCSERAWQRVLITIAIAVFLVLARILVWLAARAAQRSTSNQPLPLYPDIKFGLPALALMVVAALFINWRRGRRVVQDQGRTSDASTAISSMSSSEASEFSPPDLEGLESVEDPETTAESEPASPLALPSIPLFPVRRPRRKRATGGRHCYCGRRLRRGVDPTCSACRGIRCPRCGACFCTGRR